MLAHTTPTGTIYARQDSLGATSPENCGAKMVVHRHIMVDGVRVDRPSFHVKPGQLIHVHPKAEKTTPFQAAAAGENQAVLPEVPAYLNVEIEKLHAKLERKPKREEIPVICDEQLVVEYYSRLA